MRYKGKINIDGTGAITNTTDAGTVNGFPTDCQVGDVYKINGNTVGITSQIAGEVVSTGDMAICIKTGTGDSLNDAQYWTIIQDNVEHLITYTLNGTAFKLYAQTQGNITLYAPTTSGTSGQVLISKGINNAPEWVNAATLIVGEAAKVSNALVKGNGVQMLYQGTAEASYDGSKQITLSLAAATVASIGGVIIDPGTNSEKYNQPSNTSNTPYPTISVKSTGEIYLTKANVVNALGYDPVSALPIFTDAVDGIVPMASAANKSNTAATAATYLLGADAKWYKLPTSAFQSDKRIVQLAGTTVIAADSSNALNILAGTHVSITAAQVSGDYTGAMTFNAIWRDVQVHLVSGSAISNYVESIGDDDPLVFDNTESVFMLGEQVTVGSGANATQKTVIKSYVTWYNMDTGEYEIV
jgi:hypothetical protein